MTSSPTDTISFVIVVNGIECEGRRQLCERFPNAGGGARPGFDPPIPYSTIRCELHEIEAFLNWITTNLAGTYSSIHITVGIYAPLSWYNFSVPQQVLMSVQEYKTELMISFASAAGGSHAKAA
jgi:hypothetical protein